MDFIMSYLGRMREQQNIKSLESVKTLVEFVINKIKHLEDFTKKTFSKKQERINELKIHLHVKQDSDLEQLPNSSEAKELKKTLSLVESSLLKDFVEVGKEGASSLKKFDPKEDETGSTYYGMVSGDDKVLYSTSYGSCIGISIYRKGTEKMGIPPKGLLAHFWAANKQKDVVSNFRLDFINLVEKWEEYAGSSDKKSPNVLTVWVGTGPTCGVTDVRIQECMKLIDKSKFIFKGVKQTSAGIVERSSYLYLSDGKLYNNSERYGVELQPFRGGYEGSTKKAFKL